MQTISCDPSEVTTACCVPLQNDNVSWHILSIYSLPSVLCALSSLICINFTDEETEALND